MKFTRCAFLTLCVMVLISHAIASASGLNRDPGFHPGAGLTTCYMVYYEPDMAINGLLDGITAGCGYRFPNEPVVIHSDGELTFGSPSCDGSTGSETPAVADPTDWICELRAVAAYDMNPFSRILFTPMAGLGYRYRNNEPEDPGGYERQSRYVYSPVGLSVGGFNADGWSWQVAGEYDFFWKGMVKSRLSDVRPAFNDPGIDQDTGDGYGAGFSLVLSKIVGHSNDLSLGMYLRYWDIEPSNPAPFEIRRFPAAQVFVYEPENETTIFGLRLELQF